MVQADGYLRAIIMQKQLNTLTNTVLMISHVVHGT